MQALAGSQAKEPASKTARVEVVFYANVVVKLNQGKDKPRGFGRGLAAEKIIGLLLSGNVVCSVKFKADKENR